VADIAWQSMVDVASIGQMATDDEFAFFDKTLSAMRNVTTSLLGDWTVTNKVAPTYLAKASAATLYYTKAATLAGFQTQSGAQTSFAVIAHTHADLHSHANKTLLDKVSNADRVTPTERVNWSSAASDQHTHANKDTLDAIPGHSGITSGQVLKVSGTGLVWGAAGTGGGLTNLVSDATPQLGGNLDLNGKGFVVLAAPPSDHAFTGARLILFSAASNIPVMAAVRPTGTKMQVNTTDADLSTAGLIIGLAGSTVAGGANVLVAVEGIARDDSWALTTGEQAVVGRTPGQITTDLTGFSAGDQVNGAGIALGSTLLLIRTGYTQMEWAAGA